MKTNLNIALLTFLLSLCLSVAPQNTFAQQVSVSFQVFYDELSPYGTWVNYNDYGYVWVPDVAPGFTPYGTNGYWVFTEDGWTWVSDYPWGWAPFHYGRWFYDDAYGPMWVPDNHWGPGWVTWRRSSGYYGWAPIGPGISISIAYGSNYNPPHDHWRFVRENDFGRTNITNYYINTTNNVTIIKNSTVINNVHENKIRQVSYNAGPDRVEVEKHTGRSISPIAIKDNSKPGERFENNELQLYRPKVVKRTATTSPAPSRVSSLKELKPVRHRDDGSKPEKATSPQKQQEAQPQKNDNHNDGKQTPREIQPSNKQHQPQHIDPVNSDPKLQNKSEPNHPPREGQPIKPKQDMPLRESQPQQQQQQKENIQPVKQQQKSIKQPQNNKPPKKQENPSPRKKTE
jgi:hypothetical protein